jgi:hypothetical protein
MHGNAGSAWSGPGLYYYRDCGGRFQVEPLNPSRALVVLPVPFKLPGSRLVRVQLGPAITQCHALGFQLVSYCSTSYRTPGRPTHNTRPRLLGPGPGRDWPCRGYVGPRPPLRVLVASQLLHRDCPAAVTRVRQAGTRSCLGRALRVRVTSLIGVNHEL